MATPATERPVDLMIDLRERMVRIETKLDLRADKDHEIDATLVTLASRTTNLETDATILRARLTTLKWVGSSAIGLVVFLSDLLPRFVG